MNDLSRLNADRRGSNRKHDTLSASEAWLAREGSAMGRVHQIRFYPLVVARARGCRVWDADGNEYLDLIGAAGVMQTGYGHPRVVKAIREELGRVHSTMHCCYPSPTSIALAERLKQSFDSPWPTKVWFGTTGSDANDCLAQLLPLATGRQRLITFEGAYHGLTSGSAALSGHSAQARILGGGHITKVPYPYCYRCPWGSEPETCDLPCLRFIDEHILQTVSPGADTAAVILEAMESDGGDIPAPRRFLRGLRELCDRYGIWLVFDEVKIGLGRSGTMWAFEQSGVSADAITVGKPLGGGLPLSAVIARSELLDQDVLMLHTLAGAPVACAAGLATLAVVSEEGLLQRAALVGALLQDGLRELSNRHQCIGDVRGMGLMVGFELVEDRQTKQPAPLLAARFVYRCFELGVVVLYCGLHGNVIELTPPLTIGEGEVAQALEVFDRALADVTAGRFDDGKLARFSGW